MPVMPRAASWRVTAAATLAGLAGGGPGGCGNGAGGCILVLSWGRAGLGVGPDVGDDGGGVAAFGVQVRAGVVFGDTPHAVALIPERRPARMLAQDAQDAQDPAGCPGGRQDGRRRGMAAGCREDPAEYWAVLNEAVIRRAAGGAGVMAGQLEHIAELAGMGHVSVQVLPFSAGVHPAMDGGFSIVGFPEAGDPDVVYLENQAGSLYLEQAGEIDRYARMFSHLVAKALDPEESRRMIARLAGDLAG